jgi:hypothetical protein
MTDDMIALSRRAVACKGWRLTDTASRGIP